jgi:hypothetical protein
MSSDRLMWLECPCCGDVGAEADGEGLFTDGDSLVCGCAGSVSADEDDVSIVLSDDECGPEAKCK